MYEEITEIEREGKHNIPVEDLHPDVQEAVAKVGYDLIHEKVVITNFLNQYDKMVLSKLGLVSDDQLRAYSGRVADAYCGR